MFDGHLRNGVDQVVRPIGRSIQRLGVTADHLTVAGMVISVGTAVAIANGQLRLGLLLLILSALPDLFDGAVAKAAGTASRRGAFFDSTADRVTDAFLLGGIAWYLADTEGQQMAVLPFAVMAVASVISYMRAKAESLGFDAKGGLMERAERIIVLAVGLAFESLLVPILWVLLVLSGITMVQRFVKVWRQASDEVPLPPRAQERRRRRRLRAERRSARVERFAARRARRSAERQRH
ncbi:MAG: CDP-alcohol phosphatidyltransferase family protein [Actinomycetota bacterium]